MRRPGCLGLSLTLKNGRAPRCRQNLVAVSSAYFCLSGSDYRGSRPTSGCLETDVEEKFAGAETGLFGTAGRPMLHRGLWAEKAKVPEVRYERTDGASFDTG